MNTNNAKLVSSDPAKLDFDRDGKGAPYVNQKNIRIAMAKLGIKLEYDEFADRLLISGLADVGRHLDDRVIAHLRLLIDANFRFLPGKDLFYDVVIDEAMSNRRHPVREYLDSLVWDGKPRLDNWLVNYAGACASPYMLAVGRIVLVAAVRRVRYPGCKFDEMLVLEGSQGTGKSSLLRSLAVRDEWFSDDLPLNADTKRQMEAIAGRWIVEAGELKGMRRGEVEGLKSFLSRSVDRARLSYERLTTELARQCVIIGTTNSNKYLRDSTGHRRFWPVKTGTIDNAGLLRDRDQLWAEASKLEADGVTIRMDPRLWAAAEVEQVDREVTDGWTEFLDTLLSSVAGKVRTDDLWHALNVPVERRTQSENERLGSSMRVLGWEHKRLKDYGGKNAYFYVKGDNTQRQQRIGVSRINDAWVASHTTSV